MIQKILKRITNWLIDRYGEFKALRIIKLVIEIKDLIVATFSNWVKDDIPLHGAALAFYTIFSLAPLLIIIIALSAIFFGEQAATGQLEVFLVELIGADAAAFVGNILKNANTPFSNLLATIVGIGTITFTSTTVIAQLKSSLNLIWNVETREGQTIRQFLISRGMAFVLVLIFAVVLISSLIIDATIGVVGFRLEEILPSSLALISWINYLVFTLATIFLFTIIFKMLPDVKITWFDAMVGAVVTTGLFLLGRYLISIYLGVGNLGTTYGAAGSFVVLLIWIYYNSMTIYLGAEFTHQYTIRFGSGYEVPKHARVAKHAESSGGFRRKRKPFSKPR